MENEFVPYELALRMKALGFDEFTLAAYVDNELDIGGLWKDSVTSKVIHKAPTFSQAINFLYICSNKQIDIELKASDSYEERIRKVGQGCEDLWNLQNSKSNQ